MSLRWPKPPSNGRESYLESVENKKNSDEEYRLGAEIGYTECRNDPKLVDEGKERCIVNVDACGAR